ncbi:MAG: hypothetical protein ABEH58_03375 [Haloplanus sp.]
MSDLVPDVVTVVESAVLSLMLSATFWNAVSGYASVGEMAVDGLVVGTTGVLTTIFVLEEARSRARTRARHT